MGGFKVTVFSAWFSAKSQWKKSALSACHMSKKKFKKFMFQHLHSAKLLGGVHVSLAEKYSNAAVKSIAAPTKFVPKFGCDSIYPELKRCEQNVTEIWFRLRFM